MYNKYIIWNLKFWNVEHTKIYFYRDNHCQKSMKTPKLLYSALENALFTKTSDCKPIKKKKIFFFLFTGYITKQRKYYIVVSAKLN